MEPNPLEVKMKAVLAKQNFTVEQLLVFKNDPVRALLVGASLGYIQGLEEGQEALIQMKKSWDEIVGKDERFR